MMHVDQGRHSDEKAWIWIRIKSQIPQKNIESIKDWIAYMKPQTIKIVKRVIRTKSIIWVI